MAFELSEQQKRAVETLRKNQVVIFTGPPGSGKTTTLSHYLKDTKDVPTECFAPTGRAAQRMMEAFSEAGVNQYARTIHSGLIPDRMGHDGNGWSFVFNEKNPLPCDRVILDETSMCDNAIFSALLNAIKPGTKLICVGDPDQLPPVGKGKPFLDMIESGCVAHAKLTEVHRFAGRIAHACSRINAGKTFLPSRKIDLDSTGDFGPENLRHVERANPAGAMQTLATLVERVRQRGFDPFNDLQVIVSRNDAGPVNRKIVNQKMQTLLNPNGKQIKDCPFRVGDKVMCLKNGMRETYDFDGERWRSDKGSTYVSNGEMGIVVEVNPKSIIAKFGNAHVLFGKGMWETQVCLAYGITAHKSQGGGFPVVIYMIDDTRLNDRSLVYTAISRSKTLCFTVGRLAVLNRQIQKVSVRDRKTFLVEMIKESNKEASWNPTSHAHSL